MMDKVFALQKKKKKLRLKISVASSDKNNCNYDYYYNSNYGCEDETCVAVLDLTDSVDFIVMGPDEDDSVDHSG